MPFDTSNRELRYSIDYKTVEDAVGYRISGDKLGLGKYATYSPDSDLYNWYEDINLNGKMRLKDYTPNNPKRGHYGLDYDIELCHNGVIHHLKATSTSTGAGEKGRLDPSLPRGTRFYWRCPTCHPWKKYDIIYFDERVQHCDFKCRNCCQLIYQCQKENIWKDPAWAQLILEDQLNPYTAY